jgi:hypothetical protein
MKLNLTPDTFYSATEANPLSELLNCVAGQRSRLRALQIADAVSEVFARYEQTSGHYSES